MTARGRGRAGRHRRRLGADVRDGPGRDRAAADDGVPGLPLRARGAAGGGGLPPAAARARARGLARGPGDGRLPHRRLRASRRSGLEETSASNAGFITGLFVVFTPLLGGVFLRQRLPPSPGRRPRRSALGLYLLSGAGGDFELRGDGLVLLCAVAFAAHILVTDRAVARPRRGRPAGGAARASAEWSAWPSAAAAGDLEAPRGATVWSALIVTSLVASALGFFVQTYAQQHASPARTALILAERARVRGPVRLPAGRRAAGAGLAGRRPDPRRDRGRRAVPRLRPPRPLPEG